jgi:hypothetical protein
MQVELIIIIIIIIIMFYWAKTDKYTIKNCHSQHIIANAQKDGKKGKSPSIIMIILRKPHNKKENDINRMDCWNKSTMFDI